MIGEAVLGALVFAAAWLGFWIWAKPALRRRRLAREPVPPEWRDLLERHVAWFRRMPPERKDAFARHVAVFIRDHRWRGVEVEVTDELKVLAAASAVLLVFGRTEREYPHISEILFYPKNVGEDMRSPGDIAGLAHPYGAVVLSVPELRRSFASETDGYHVGLHEFAHQLDFRGMEADGVPLEMDPRLFAPWCAVMRKEIERIRKGRGALRAYGGTNEAEFWAVAVETFFERPEALRRANPEMYEILKTYFGG